MRRKRLSSKAASSRERRCAASGEVKGEADLLRLAVAPDDTLVPDVAAKLPGRGIWISADRASIELAAKKGLFNRSAGKAVVAPDDLADRFEGLLEARVLSLLGLARKAGDLALGADAARLALKAQRPVWRIEAVDGSAEGRRKLDALSRAAWGDIPVAGCFTAEQLGDALGRGPVVHGVLADGAQAPAIGMTLRKLSGFRALDGSGAEAKTA